MKLKRKIKAMTGRNTTLASARDKIEALNLLLRGWSNYHRHSCASQTFSHIGSFAFKRMELWLRKKTGLRVKRVYREYYRRHNGYLTWVSGGVALHHPGTLTRIRYVRYRHRPNPYLNPGQEAELPYHLTPYPGKRDWQGYDGYGEDWSAVREQVRDRDDNRCQVCGSNERIEAHHIRKHKPHRRHDPAKVVTLCADCHRQARNPRSNVSRRLARFQLETGEPCALKDASTVRGGG